MIGFWFEGPVISGLYIVMSHHKNEFQKMAHFPLFRLTMTGCFVVAVVAVCQPVLAMDCPPTPLNIGGPDVCLSPTPPPPTPVPPPAITFDPIVTLPPPPQPEVPPLIARPQPDDND